MATPNRSVVIHSCMAQIFEGELTQSTNRVVHGLLVIADARE